jgi:hypothetical protein
VTASASFESRPPGRFRDLRPARFVLWGNIEASREMIPLDCSFSFLLKAPARARGFLLLVGGIADRAEAIARLRLWDIVGLPRGFLLLGGFSNGP